MMSFVLVDFSDVEKKDTHTNDLFLYIDVWNIKIILLRKFMFILINEIGIGCIFLYSFVWCWE